METTIPRPTATLPHLDAFSVSGRMFDKTESTWKGNIAVGRIEDSGSYSAKVSVRYDFANLDVSLVLQEPTNLLARRYFQSIAREIREQHPGIVINESVKGIPTIKGNRLSVGQVLGRVYALGSIDAVVAYYRSTVSKEQIRQAIAFAQDFLEAACEPI